MKRIHKIKTKTTVKETISDEDIEKLRDNCDVVRDIAIIDLLYSTGMRVGAYSYLVIQFTPLASGTTFNAASSIQLPCTFYTLANASGQ